MDLTSYVLGKKYTDNRVTELTGLDMTSVNGKINSLESALADISQRLSALENGSVPPIDTTAPTIIASPSGGTFSSMQTVTLSANEISTIYYTTDGTVPTTSSNVYTAPISISVDTILKLFARDSVGNNSSVQTETYKFISINETMKTWVGGVQ